MKKQNVIELISFTCLFIIILLFMSNIFRPRLDVNGAIIDYQKLKNNTVDTLFIGDSNIYTSVSPMEIYGLTGFTSYDYASPSASNLLMYYMLQEALKTQKPKLVIMDVGSIFSHTESHGFTHQYLDNIPFDDVKINVLNDKYYKFNFGDKLYFLFPFFKFHDRWHELGAGDLFKNRQERYLSYEMGFSTNNITRPAPVTYMSKRRKSSVKFTDKTAAKMILQNKNYCEKRGIKFLLIAMPDAKHWSYMRYKKMTKWARENDVDYLDFNMKLQAINIDYSVDSYDGGVHLNIDGAIKLSRYLAIYLKDNYRLPDHRLDSKYVGWNINLAKHKNHIAQEAKKWIK